MSTLPELRLIKCQNIHKNSKSSSKGGLISESVLIQVILFEIDCTIFYTNLHKMAKTEKNPENYRKLKFLKDYIENKIVTTN